MDECKSGVFTRQVFRFVQNLIGCEEQARLFKEEVSSTVVKTQVYLSLLLFCAADPLLCLAHVVMNFDTFACQMIDGEAFLLLTQTDIVKIMSIKLGPALKISNAILMFKSTDEGLK